MLVKRREKYYFPKSWHHGDFKNRKHLRLGQEGKELKSRARMASQVLGKRPKPLCNKAGEKCTVSGQPAAEEGREREERGVTGTLESARDTDQEQLLLSGHSLAQ